MNDYVDLADLFARSNPSPPSPKPRLRRGEFDGKLMPWGKHVGVAIDEVPVMYIAWIFTEQLAGAMVVQAPLASALFALLIRRVTALPVYHEAMRGIVAGYAAEGARAPSRPISITEETL